METKTFKDVHADLEKEAILIKTTTKSTVEDFIKKGRALAGAGFTNSIATKMYNGLAQGNDWSKIYDQKYCGKYKFIIEPQLERLCERYNLFVRHVNLFVGDIPEQNVSEIINAWVYFPDLDVSYGRGYVEDKVDSILRDLNLSAQNKTLESFYRNGYKVPLVNMFEIFERFNLKTPISIAATKNLFDKKAFEGVGGNNRIINGGNTDATGEVDLDPIVLLKVKGGYLIITAWGDEANDEIVLNSKNN